MNLSILFPYRATPERQQIFSWVLDRYDHFFPGAEICIADCDGTHFNRAQAVNRAAKLSTKDYFLIADADVAFFPESVLAALTMVVKNPKTWVFPHSNYYIATPEYTETLLASDPDSQILEEEIRGFETIKSNTSALVVLSREAFDSIGGYDERFVGWGYEDNAFFHAMNTVWGNYSRVSGGYALHLWHPAPHGVREKNPFLKQNVRLCTRYERARFSREKMIDLCAEWKNDC